MKFSSKPLSNYFFKSIHSKSSHGRVGISNYSSGESCPEDTTSQISYRAIYGASCAANENFDNSLVQRRRVRRNRVSEESDNPLEFSSGWEVNCGIRLINRLPDSLPRSISHDSTAERICCKNTSYPIVSKPSRFSDFSFLSKRLFRKDYNGSRNIEESMSVHPRDRKLSTPNDSSLNPRASSLSDEDRMSPQDSHPGINEWSYTPFLPNSKSKDASQRINGRVGEDYFHVVASPDRSWFYASIFDGFYGTEAADFLTHRLFPPIQDNLKSWRKKLNDINALSEQDRNKSAEVGTWVSHVSSALVNTISLLEEDYFSAIKKKWEENPQLALIGSTVIVILVIERHVFSLNLGDSRSLICSSSISPSTSPATYFEPHLTSNEHSQGYESGILSRDAQEDSLVTSLVTENNDLQENAILNNSLKIKNTLVQNVRQQAMMAEDTESSDRSVTENFFSPLINFDELRLEETLSSLTITQLSRDHNVHCQKEISLISSLHPDDSEIISEDRLKGHLKLTRAFGCAFLKQKEWSQRLFGRFRIKFSGDECYLMSQPHVEYRTLDDNDKFLILASDGIFMYLTNEETVWYVDNCIRHSPDLNPAVCLISEVFERSTKGRGMSFEDLSTIPPGDSRRKIHDDLSVIIIPLC